MRGLFSDGGLISTEGNLRFKIDWASLKVRGKFTIFALFCFVFEGNFQVQAPRGLIFGWAILRRFFFVTSLRGLYLRGEAYLYMEGLIFGILRYFIVHLYTKTRQDIYYHNITSTIFWHAVSKKTLVEACQINSQYKEKLIRGF